MTVLTPGQKVLLRELADASLRYKDAAVNAHPRARAAADAQIEQAAKIQDDLAARAAAAGIPILRIATDGMHTTNRKTARAAIARGKEES